MPRDRYFAYGSNLEPARMTRRVPSARSLGIARLDDFSWHLDKRGMDGSAKANVRRAPGQRVWGVVYEIDAGEWPALDVCEAGYERVRAAVLCTTRTIDAHLYVCGEPVSDLSPFDWYKRLMLDGARHHGLPAEWIAMLHALRAR